MNITFLKITILVMLCTNHLPAFSQEEVVLRDYSEKPNPNQNKLNSLYSNESDTFEIYYVPELKLPDLFFIENNNDTVFI